MVNYGYLNKQHTIWFGWAKVLPWPRNASASEIGQRIGRADGTRRDQDRTGQDRSWKLCCSCADRVQAGDRFVLGVVPSGHDWVTPRSGTGASNYETRPAGAGAVAGAWLQQEKLSNGSSSSSSRNPSVISWWAASPDECEISKHIKSNVRLPYSMTFNPRLPHSLTNRPVQRLLACLCRALRRFVYFEAII